MRSIMQSTLTIDNYFDRIFYLNLDKDSVRNRQMVEQFEKFGISNYERVSAIEIEHMPPKETYRNFIKNAPQYIIGNTGARARGYQRILIFEDDALFKEDPNLLLQLNSNILNDWDMLYFGGFMEHFFRNQIVCTHAYAVKHTIFDDIIYTGEASGMEIDNFYAKIIQHMSYNYNQSGKYNVRIIQPFNLIVQDGKFQSNIQLT